jgi:hypothetical protein
VAWTAACEVRGRNQEAGPQLRGQSPAFLRWDSGSIPRQSTCDYSGESSTVTRLSQYSTSVLPCQCHSTYVPYPSSEYCAYQKGKRPKPWILQTMQRFPRYPRLQHTRRLTQVSIHKDERYERSHVRRTRRRLGTRKRHALLLTQLHFPRTGGTHTAKQDRKCTHCVNSRFVSTCNLRCQLLTCLYTWQKTGWRENTSKGFRHLIKIRLTVKVKLSLPTLRKHKGVVQLHWFWMSALDWGQRSVSQLSLRLRKITLTAIE